MLWHRLLAHLNSNDITKLHVYANVVTKPRQVDEVCSASRLGKAHKLPFKSEFARAQEVVDVVHFDMDGPCEPSIPEKYRNFATFQDDNSRYIFVDMMRCRSELGEMFKELAHRFSKMLSKATGTLTVRKEHESYHENCTNKLHSDNAKEYFHLGNRFRAEINRSFAPPYTPELKDIAERVYPQSLY